MRLAIDNFDGLGAVDYSAAMCSAETGLLTRTLNAPSGFRVGLLLAGTALRVPVRRARVLVSDDTGTVLFTGYLPTEPEVETVGGGPAGDDVLLLLRAESDEWLLDQQGSGAGGAGFGLAGDALLRTLTSRTDPQRFAVSTVGTIRPVGVFTPVAARSWSDNAKALADAAYASYRVLAGSVELQPAGAVSHSYQYTDGSLNVMDLHLQEAKALANDVTVLAEREPGAYITEVFAGDGTTTEFVLTAIPFRPTGRAAVPVFAESFAAPGFTAAGSVWSVSDPGSHLSFGAPGLILGGGNGLDGQTTLTAQDAVELGGTVVLEVGGVLLNQGSDGVLCGLYSGPVNRTNCVAGFDVRQSNGATVVSALINGADAGSPFTLLNGHGYTLRVRVFAAEMYRVQQTYTTMVDGVATSFGGGLVPSALQVVCELVDLGASSNTPATILFDGTLANAPAVATFAPIDSVQLLGSVSTVRVTREGPVRVTSTSSAGTAWTRLLGAAGQGLDGEVTAGGRLRFYAGRVPQAGELVRVFYRTSQPAGARLQNTSSITAEGAGGLPGVAQWTGHVTEPITRNSGDCAAAAAALLSIATSRTAALSGVYTAENPGDVWPGDLLRVEQNGVTTALMVQEVEVRDALALPELLTCTIKVANDWAKPLGLTLSTEIAAATLLPLAVTPATQPANLSSLSVVSVSETAVQLDMGTAPPAGGGFEVRRRDGGFTPGQDPDLVVRSPVQGFSIPRVAEAEQLFVRMYDGSATPVYSRVSTAIYTHVPVG